MLPRKIWISLLFLALNALGQNANEFGGTLGWGGPYGAASVHYSRSFLETQSLGLGLGISGAGPKYGIDYKVFFFHEEEYNPYIGLGLSRASGASKLNVSVNADTAVYKVNAGNQLTPRAGFRYSFTTVRIYLNVGYGIVLSGGGVEYVSGSEEKSVKEFAEAVAIGGMEVSGSGVFSF